MEKLALKTENPVASVFVHVTNLQRAAEWYSRLLGLSVIEERLNDGPVYWFDFPGTNLILDSNVNNRKDPEWQEYMKPEFMLAVQDLDDAYTSLKKYATVYSQPEWHGSMGYFNFADPEGNVMMACWHEHNKANSLLPESNSPIQAKISSVFVNVKNMEQSARWYTQLLDEPLKEKEMKESIYTIENNKGAWLLLDDNRHRNGDDYNILFMFHTKDVDAAYDYAKQLNLDIFSGIERHGDIAFFTLRDPDLNIIMVCQ